MKAILTSALVAILCAGSLTAQAAPTHVFINEFHYDNTGTDTGEFIEIAGPAGTDLSGWAVALYNGANGSLYNTLALTGLIPDQQSGFGFFALGLPTNGLQNGGPDGIALVNSIGELLQFLSYEGSFSAVAGPANGLTSVDIGVRESGSTPIGFSLRLTGTGTVYEDFTWASASAETPGAINDGQTFINSVPEPTSLALIFVGLAALRLGTRKRA